MEVKVVETLLDTVDTNGDGIIKYDEFANIVMAGQQDAPRTRCTHLQHCTHTCTALPWS